MYRMSELRNRGSAVGESLSAHSVDCSINNASLPTWPAVIAGNRHAGELSAPKSGSKPRRYFTTFSKGR
jgi:hypothetical protein